MKKILVAYYSQTGNTRKIAERIAKEINADIDEIRVEGTHEQFKEVKISFKKNPEEYDLIIVGTPVWAFNPVPAIKKYLIENKSKIKKIAFFCTNEGLAGFTFLQMKKCSKKPIAKLNVHMRRKNKRNYIEKFCEGLK